MYNIQESEVIQSLGHRLVVAQSGVSHASLSMATHRSLGLLCVREQHRLGRLSVTQAVWLILYFPLATIQVLGGSRVAELHEALAKQRATL